MAHWKEHASDCAKELGKDWVIVHQWLDEFAGVYWPSKLHRLHRHHREGIEEIRSKWGDEAAKAAEIHILKDEGNIPSKAEIHARYGIKDDLGD
jgi:DNA-binding GntR family transcriptional regulator